MIKRIFAIAALFIAQAGFAHPGHDVASSATAGLMHPLTGLDHLAALLSAGVLFAATSQRARWIGVAALTVSLAAGAGIALLGVVVTWGEWVIGLSVLVAGSMLVYSHRSGVVHPALLISGTTIFALFHGYAHGVEISGDAYGFVVGFLLASLTIVVVAMQTTRVVSRHVTRRRVRLA
jgi:urease accessory protein